MKLAEDSKSVRSAFTLVELMVATAILAVILILVFSITQQTSEAWKSSAAKIESFQSARAAFEAMTRRIGQATLNTFYDYFDESGTRRTAANAAIFLPEKYGRYSDLHFITGKNLLNGEDGAPTQITHSIFFNLPRGYTQDTDYKAAGGTINSAGYYLEYSEDPSRPPFLAAKLTEPTYRYRLMEYTQPTEKTSIYGPYVNESDAKKWFVDPLSVAAADRPARQIADNIVAMLILPRREDEQAGSGPGLAPDFEYDSRITTAWSAGKQPAEQNQLPPQVEIVLVAIDQTSAIRLGNPSVAPSLGQEDLFQTSAKLEDNLDEFERNLREHQPPLRYQVFRTVVPLRSSRWSE